MAACCARYTTDLKTLVNSTSQLPCLHVHCMSAKVDASDRIGWCRWCLLPTSLPTSTAATLPCATIWLLSSDDSEASMQQRADGLSRKNLPTRPLFAACPSSPSVSSLVILITVVLVGSNYSTVSCQAATCMRSYDCLSCSFFCCMVALAFTSLRMTPNPPSFSHRYISCCMMLHVHST